MNNNIIKWVLIMTTFGLVWVQVCELKDSTPHYHIETPIVQMSDYTPTGIMFSQVSGSQYGY
jgi:hypothetical protein